MIWALNDNIPERDDSFEKHTDRGAKSMMLIGMPVDNTPLPAGTKTLEFLANDVEIPSDRDTVRFVTNFL